jgi:hypothetical protein
VRKRVKRTYLYRAWTEAHLLRYEPFPGEPVVTLLDVSAAARLFVRLDVRLVPHAQSSPEDEPGVFPSACQRRLVQASHPPGIDGVLTLLRSKPRHEIYPAGLQFA